jgi:hypothetical protein
MKLIFRRPGKIKQLLLSALTDDQLDTLIRTRLETLPPKPPKVRRLDPADLILIFPQRRNENAESCFSSEVERRRSDSHERLLRRGRA